MAVSEILTPTVSPKSTPIRLGMITPSCNTVLEPTTNELISSLAETSAHFARVRVGEISLAERALHQFDHEHMIEVARLLSDARVRSIAWNGTSGAWCGLHHDLELCTRIENELGVAATSAALAIDDLLHASGAKRIGLFSPYTWDVQDRIIAQLASCGYDCVNEEHLDASDGYSFGLVSESAIGCALQRIAATRPDAIIVMCTNLRGTWIGARIESDTGVLVIDSIAAVLWKSMLLAKLDPKRLIQWGKIFSLTAE